MGFTDAVRTGFRKYATFSGTATRPEYWWFALFNFVVGVALSALQWTAVSNIWSLALLVPSLAVGVRRLHDTGRSAWWLLTGLLFPWLIYLLCQPGTVRDNPYATGAAVADGVVTNADAPVTSSYCPTCGQLRLPGQAYCAKCGTELPKD